MNLLGRFYQSFWFHTEFWLTRVDRRPYTFIMRDWLYSHVVWFVAILVAYFGGLFTWVVFNPLPASIVIFLSAFLLAHLVWGSKWIEGQQEYPEYLGQ